MKPIHPFPARMAPEAINGWISDLTPNSTVLDPMCGSGVVLRQAMLAGHKTVGFDLDPLAVLMTQVWTSKLHAQLVFDATDHALSIARSTYLRDIHLDWIDTCSETTKFIHFWFARPQKNQLRKLSAAIFGMRGAYPDGVLDLLWLAVSRTIVTKHRGASLAWDVSHSRPHKVRTENDFDVFDGFEKAVKRIVTAHGQVTKVKKSKIHKGDARKLRYVRKNSIDAIFTSPPYLNAIDYLRGHKLSLVWMGYSIPKIREIRSNSIGSERRIDCDAEMNLVELIFSSEPALTDLDSRMQNIVKRYIWDAHELISKCKRVLKPDGRLGLVIGDSSIRGVFVRNSNIFCKVAEAEGFTRVERKKREILSSRRYLPGRSSTNTLEKRMRHEILQLFSAPA